MFKSVYTKTLFNLRWQLIGWTLGAVFIAFITMALYNSLSQSGINSIIATVPDSLKPLIGSIEDYTTIPGYIGQQIFGPNLYIITIAMSVILALAVTVNEEDDRRLQTLLSMPVTRTGVFFQKWLAVTTVIVIVSASVIGGIYLGLLVVDKSADIGRIIASACAFALINITFATITFAFGMFTGKRGLTMSLMSAYAVACLVLTTLAPATDSLKSIDKASLLHYYNNPQIMQYGLTATHLVALACVCILALGVGLFRFQRRNIGT